MFPTYMIRNKKALFLAVQGFFVSYIIQLFWVQRGRSTYYQVHFIVGEASPLCPLSKFYFVCFHCYLLFLYQLVDGGIHYSLGNSDAIHFLKFMPVAVSKQLL